MKSKLIFPTLILEEQLTGSVFNNVSEELDQVLQTLKFSLNLDDDTGGLEISDEGISDTNDIINRYNLKYLKNEIMRCAKTYLSKVDVNFEVTLKPIVAVMTRLQPEKDSVRHSHLPTSLVVVYYHRVPENSGNIRLHTPVQYLEYQKEQYVDIVPATGKLLIFPGWLHHEVLKNNSSESRYSIAITLQICKEANEN